MNLEWWVVAGCKCFIEIICFALWWCGNLSGMCSGRGSLSIRLRVSQSYSEIG